MFKKTVLMTFTLLICVAVAAPSYSQDLAHPGRDNSKVRVSPNGEVSQTVGTAVFSISYSRPSVKGRTVFGELEPFGKVWRSGANEATTIVVPVDVTVEGQALAAGVYALFTIPGEKEWSVIFNSQATQWGAFDHNPDLDVLVVKVNAEKTAHTEQLTYSFEDVTPTSTKAVLRWGTTAVPFQIALAD